MNTITINFIPCTPAPANGYKLTWRVAGSSDPYTDEGFFTESPAIFTDNINPEGTCYEGFLQSDCSESGESGSLVGNAIPWATICEEESGAFDYTIELSAPCSGVASNYTINGGVEGDTIKVRASFVGILQKISGSAVRADLSISSVDQISGDTVYSNCYSDSSPHPFSITADCVILVPAGGSTIVNLGCFVNNSSSSMSGVTVCIIEINGTPVSICASGCVGNSSTGLTC